jgi:hypothetical protein
MALPVPEKAALKQAGQPATQILPHREWPLATPVLLVLFPQLVL